MSTFLTGSSTVHLSKPLHPSPPLSEEMETEGPRPEQENQVTGYGIMAGDRDPSPKSCVGFHLSLKESTFPKTKT